MIIYNLRNDDFYLSPPRDVPLASQHVSFHEIQGNNTNKWTHEISRTSLAFDIMLLCFPTGELHITDLSYSTDLNCHSEGDKEYYQADTITHHPQDPMVSHPSALISFHIIIFLPLVFIDDPPNNLVKSYLPLFLMLSFYATVFVFL